MELGSTWEKLPKRKKKLEYYKSNAIVFRRRLKKKLDLILNFKVKVIT